MRIVIASCLALIFASCFLTKNSLKQMAFDWEGHRGCRGLFPENTIPAMLHAVDLGVTTLEMDAVITSDRQVILSHEPFFDHEITTKPNGSVVKEDEEKSLNIFSMTYQEVSLFDVGMKEHPRFPGQVKMKATKPRLSDVIDSVEAYTTAKKLPAKYYNIETKSKAATDNIYHPPPAEFVEAIVRVIQEKKVESRTIIQSFDVRTLQYLHQKYPRIKTALLVENAEGMQQNISTLGFTPTIYSPEFNLVNATMVKLCHEKKMQVLPWTVNDIAKMRELKEMGVDGIITDYPNRIF